MELVISSNAKNQILRKLLQYSRKYKGTEKKKWQDINLLPSLEIDVYIRLNYMQQLKLFFFIIYVVFVFRLLTFIVGWECHYPIEALALTFHDVKRKSRDGVASETREMCLTEEERGKKGKEVK